MKHIIKYVMLALIISLVIPNVAITGDKSWGDRAVEEVPHPTLEQGIQKAPADPKLKVTGDEYVPPKMDIMEQKSITDRMKSTMEEKSITDKLKSTMGEAVPQYTSSGGQGASFSGMKFAGEELLPPNAKPGECYARVFVPPTYKTVTERMLMKEAGDRIQTYEPQFEIAEEKVMVQPPSTRLETVPAQYEWIEASDIGLSGGGSGGLSGADLLNALKSKYPSAVDSKVIPATYSWAEERVMIQPEHKHLRPVAPIYKTVKEQVLSRPAHTVWKKGRGPIERLNNATGEIMCLVEVPATYKTITKRMLVTPASTREDITPAKYKTVKKKIIKTPARVQVKVVKTPAHVREIDIPARYQTVKVKNLTQEAKASTFAIEPSYQTVTKREQITEGSLEWQPILCETNATPNLVLSIQRALKSAGFNPGPIDGDLGRNTMTAVQAYQKSKGLPEGRLTYETMRSLGVKF